MKGVLVVLFALVLPALATPDNDAVALWVQLVHGTHAAAEAQPASWKRIGPDLNKRLTGIFRWQEYWEVARAEIVAEPGRVAKTRLGSERDIAISFKSPTELEVRLYRNGHLVRKAHRTLKQNMTIMGGDADQKEAWFVVVRRDKPQAE